MASSSSVIGATFLGASRSGDLRLVKELASKLDDGGEGAIDKIRDIEDRTALHFAAAARNTHICTYLIKQLKVDVNAQDVEGETPLLYATLAESLQTALYLLDNGADIAKTNKRGFTPLHYAALNGRKDFLELFISRGAEIEANSDEGTPLVCAVRQGYSEAVKVLLQNNANPNVVIHNVSTPLLLSSVSSLEITDLLVKAGADPNIYAGGITPLHNAIAGDKVRIIKCLLKAGANPNLLDCGRRRKAERSGEGPVPKSSLVLHGSKKRPDSHETEGWTEVSSKKSRVTESPSKKRLSSRVTITEHSGARLDQKKRSRPEDAGKGKATEVVQSKKDQVVEATISINRDPRLAKVSVDQLAFDLWTDTATIESHVLSIPGLITKVQARCVELEHRYNKARAELVVQKEEADKRYKKDGDEITRLKEELETTKKELEKKKSQRTEASKDVQRLKMEKRVVETRLRELTERVGPNGEKAVEAFKSSDACVDWLIKEAEAMMKFAEQEYFFRGQLAARERAKTFFPPSNTDFLEIMEAPAPEFWEIPDLPSYLKHEAYRVMSYIKNGMDEVGDESPDVGDQVAGDDAASVTPAS